jgi:glycosyltransferase involved in cell wall biosynthesis
MLKMVLIRGRAADANEVVQQARVVLAPLRFGAGIKGKLVEAMLCGTPSVTTSIVLNLCRKLALEWFIADDVELFKPSSTVIPREELWLQAQKNGLK